MPREKFAESADNLALCKRGVEDAIAAFKKAFPNETTIPSFLSVPSYWDRHIWTRLSPETGISHFKRGSSREIVMALISGKPARGVSQGYASHYARIYSLVTGGHAMTEILAGLQAMAPVKAEKVPKVVKAALAKA